MAEDREEGLEYRQDEDADTQTGHPLMVERTRGAREYSRNARKWIITFWGQAAYKYYQIGFRPFGYRQAAANAACAVQDFKEAVWKLNQLLLARHTTSGLRKLKPGQINPLSVNDFKHLALWTGKGPFMLRVKKNQEKLLPFAELTASDLRSVTSLGFDIMGLLTNKEVPPPDSIPHSNLVPYRVTHPGAPVGDAIIPSPTDETYHAGSSPCDQVNEEVPHNERAPSPPRTDHSLQRRFETQKDALSCGARSQRQTLSPQQVQAEPPTSLPPLRPPRCPSGRL